MNLLNSQRLQILVDGFEAVLSNGGAEEDVHAYLAKNNFLFDGIAPHGDTIKLSKFKLGSEYITDFVLLGGVMPVTNAIRPSVAFIEIERADRPLFTANGDPSATLTHAVRQVQDWKIWIEPNLNYARNILKTAAESVIASLPAEGTPEKKELRRWRGSIKDIPDLLQWGFRCRYLVIVGRRTSMTMPDRLRLERMNQDMRDIEIMTFDELLDRFLHQLSLARRIEEEFT